MKGYTIHLKNKTLKVTGYYTLSEIEKKHCTRFFDDYKFEKNHVVIVYQSKEDIIGYYFSCNRNKNEILINYKSRVNSNCSLKAIIEINNK